MRKNAKTTTSRKIINDEYYSKKGYDINEDLNVRGKPKRVLSSFQCERKLWNEFDKLVEEHHGRYKKSYIIESLIRQYMSDVKSDRYKGGSAVKLADRLSSDRSLRD